MQTPEKMAHNDMQGHSGPSPTGEKLSQILSSGVSGGNRSSQELKGSIGSGL